MPATLEAIGLGLAMTRKRVKEESGGKREKERKKERKSKAELFLQNFLNWLLSELTIGREMISEQRCVIY